MPWYFACSNRARGSTGGALGRSKSGKVSGSSREPALAAPYPVTITSVISPTDVTWFSLLLHRLLQFRWVLASSCASEMLVDEGQRSLGGVSAAPISPALETKSTLESPTV